MSGPSQALIRYISQYCGRCRDCADTWIKPVCEGTGLPCGEGDQAIRHVLAALYYGVRNGFIARDDEPAALSIVRAEARREALEEAARIAAGWETTAANDVYMTCGNGHFWDPGTNYDQARADAGAVIRALMKKERIDAPA